MAEHVATLWGKTADFASAVADYPGVYDTTEAITPGDMYATGGAYLESNSGGTADLTNDSGNMILTVDDTDLIVGMYARIEDVNESGNDPGYYLIEALLGGGVRLSGTALDGSAVINVTDVVSFYIGGVSDAFDGEVQLQYELDYIGLRCGASPANAINNLDILCYASTETDLLTSSIVVDAIAGSGETKVLVACKDTDFAIANKLVITTNVALANGLFDLGPDADTQYTEFRDFDLDGGGKAEYCVNDSGGLRKAIIFTNCLIHDADDSGVRLTGQTSVLYPIVFSNCDIYDNEQWGIEPRVNEDQGAVTINGCSIHGNGAGGVRVGRNSSITNNLIYSNTGPGIAFDSDYAYGCIVSNNTIYNNTLDGIRGENGSQNMILDNNTCVNNGGYGFNLNIGGTPNIAIFRNNHAYNNTSGHYSMGADGTFADFMQGGNISGDPDFTDAGDDIFTFPPTSPLYLGGVGGKMHIGAEVATQSGSGGGLLTHPGMGGGMRG